MVRRMSWTGWAALNGGYTGGLEALGQNADGRLDAFGLAPASGGQAAFHNAQTAPNNGWGGWTSLGSPPQNDVLSHLEVAANADGRLEAFLRYGAMSTGAMWHAWQSTPNGSWGGWVALGVSVGHVTSGPIVVASNADGRLELYAIASPDGVTHAWQLVPNGGWSSQAFFGSPGGVSVGSPAVGSNADGRLQVFVSGSDGAVWQIAQTAANNGWGSWSSLGKPATDSLAGGPVIGTNADGRLEVFATGSQGVWHAWQTSAGGSWSSWDNLGFPSGSGGTSALAVAQNADGRQELFATVSAGEVWHIWQTAPNSGWASWSSLGGEPYAEVLAARNQDGRLEVFVEGRSTATPPGPSGVWHRWQTSPGGAWS
jgi:hypothetical protein